MATQNTSRPLAEFHSDVWGQDYFASFSLPHLEFDSYGKQVEELKGKVVDMLLMGSTSNINPIEKIISIDLLCRLGISYHFEAEIQSLLKHIFNDHVQMKNSAFGDDCDLNIAALVFRVLRQHGYRMSCDIFNKFKNSDGKFKETITRDVKGMLSLYEAAHLRVRGEDILDEALVFTTANLKSNAHDHPLAKQVFHALVHPLHKGVPRLEARRYISFYQEDESRDETLLKLAVLDFNRVQLLHQHELGLISRWWKELNFAKKLSYTRQRIVELYFWMLLYHEPQYSSGRIILTKVCALITTLDDTYDAYATFDEIQSLTDAIQKWDESVVDKLPDYMQIIFNTLLNTYNDFENDLSKEERAYAASYSKEAMKELVMGYFIEAKWLNEDHFPKFDVYLKNALTTTGIKLLSVSALVGMSHEIATRDAFEWMQSTPKCMKSCQIIGRLLDDIAGHKVEQERKHIPSAVQCYMRQYGVPEEDAEKMIREMVENAWKDLNEECLSPTTVSMPILMPILNLARSAEVIYQFGEDGFTSCAPHIKDYITSLFVDPIPISD